MTSSDYSLLATRCSPTRSRIVCEARAWIGTPYHHQASVRGVGCDCLGLVRGVWRALHGCEPEPVAAYSRDVGGATATETLLAAGRRHLVGIDPADVRPGDVLAFRIRRGMVAKHCGILVEAGARPRFVHAQEHVPVCEVALSDWWRRRIVAAFTFPGVSGGPPHS